MALFCLPLEKSRKLGDYCATGRLVTAKTDLVALRVLMRQPHDQTNPAVSGNAVVWEDNREGNTQIFAIVLDGPEVARCTSKLTGDVNGDCKVDFDDQAIMLSQWLECNLEPNEACLPY